SRSLTGRFLHITDLHLDRFYKPGTSTDENEACHHGEGDAGSFGSAGTDCDSPESLINETFAWIDKNLKDDIDFVVWTGDSARHDNDERIPRTENQVEEFNAVVVKKFEDVFRSGRNDDPSGTLAIPIVPNIGNNDVMPHNIFEKGPNRWTEILSKLWKPFIPEEQRHTFLQGGWFETEVIPNKLSVFSLNTLYFFDSNNAVDGCAQKSEPGYQQMEWLRVQLQLLRERGMKAILMGHVPPARSGDKQAWDETCWQKYTLWLRKYRDVVVVGLYGHMNIDHFMLQDSEDVDIDSLLLEIPSPRFVEANNYENFTIQSKASYLTSLRDQWAGLPSPPASVLEDEWSAETDALDELKKKKKRKSGGKKKKKRDFFKKIDGPFAERYSISMVSPSVVPNYYPTLRVMEYNITGLEHTPTWADVQRFGQSELKRGEKWDEREIEIQKSKLRIPDGPAKSAPPGPAYSNQPFALLNYAQYYANITKAEKSSKDSHIQYELEYHTRDDGVYKLPDLTVRSLFQLAKRIGEAADTSINNKHKDTSELKKKGRKKVWRAFLERAFVGMLDDDKFEDIA
ncbi:Metallo-dependent phosphatase-like protein, partial [Talaromyces proteolyticus]